MTDPTRLTFDKRAVSALDWTSDGRQIVFSSNRAGPYSLWKTAVDGGVPEPLAPGGEDAIWPAVAHRGHCLVHEHRFRELSIWRTDGRLIATHAEPGGNRTRLIFSQRTNSAPQFSSDGRKLTFQSERSGNQEIWISNSDGTNPVQVTSFGGPGVGNPRWSPDGRFR